MSFTIQTIQNEQIRSSVTQFTGAQFSLTHNGSVAEFELSVLVQSSTNDFFANKIACTATRTSAGVVAVLNPTNIIITGVGSGGFAAMSDAQTIFDANLTDIRLRITPTSAVTSNWLVHGTVKLYY